MPARDDHAAPPRRARPTRWRIASLVLLASLLAALVYLATTNDARVWPVRNTLQYRLLTWWWARAGPPQRGAPGTLRGTVRDVQGKPLAGAHVLVSRWDGAAYSAISGDGGTYWITGVPPGWYVPVAGAAGYADVAVGARWLSWPRVQILAGRETIQDVVLPALPPPALAPGNHLALGESLALSCETPLKSQAVRRTLTFDSGGRPNQQTFLYTPQTPAQAAPALPASRLLPLLLAVYPGPADEWECASVPLAQAGYAVVAVGPAYSFELERDVDELARLLVFAHARQLPGVDGTRVAVLGGSYSSLHVQRLLQREQGIQAALLLGPLTDLFDMRRRYEDRTFVPPFGLDQALVALGLPDREPLRYWRYSSVYHVRPDLPPLALIHSRSDDVVPFQQSEALARALAAAGVPYELHVVEGAGHYLLSEDQEALDIYQMTLDFLAKRLAP